MCRSGSAATVSALVVGAALVVGLGPGASAAPAPGATTSRRPVTRTVYAPPPLPTAGFTPQVRTITPVMAEIRSRTVDDAGTAEVARGRSRLDVVLDANVLFGKDSDMLQPAAHTRLHEVAQMIAGYQRAGTLAIDGYTDDLGSEAHGLDLSRRRAAAVEKVLRPLLPPTVTITVTGHGEADPAYPNDSEANRAKNRRVELHYTAH